MSGQVKNYLCLLLHGKFNMVGRLGNVLVLKNKAFCYRGKLETKLVNWKSPKSTKSLNWQQKLGIAGKIPGR